MWLSPGERVPGRRVGRSVMQTDRDDGGVVVCTESALCTDVKANGHALVADEPRALGGRKGWPLDTVTVRVEHGRIHAKDCEECETKSGRIDRIELELELEGPLDAEQRDRLREIADKCPVKRTLGSEMLIETRTATK